MPCPELKLLLQDVGEQLAVVRELVEQGDPATEALERLTEVVQHSGQAVAMWMAEKSGLAENAERALAEACGSLEESLRQLQAAQRCAKVVLRDVGEQLNEVRQGQQCARAYQAQSAR